MTAGQPAWRGEDIGRLAGRRDAEHRPPLVPEAGDGRGQRGGLARTGGPDHDHQARPAGNCPGGGLLRIAVSCRRGLVDGGARPGEEGGFLGEHRWGGEAPVGDMLADRPSVPPPRSPRGHGRVQLLAARCCLSGEVIDQSCQLPGGGGGAGWEEGGDVSGQVGDQPVGLLRRHPLQRDGDDRVGVDGFGAGQCGLPAGEPLEAVTGGAGLGLPVGPEHGGVDGVVFARPAGGDGPPLQQVQVAGAGLDTVFVGPAGDQLGQLRFDLPGPLREHLTQLLRHPGHIRLARPLRDRLPVEAEPAGQLGAQGGVVDPRQGPLLGLEPPGIQRQPHAGAVLDLGGDHCVGVQLRVGGTACVLAEHPRRKALGVDLVHPPVAAAGDQPVPLFAKAFDVPLGR